MAAVLFVTGFDSLLLTAGLLALCIGFTLEWTQTRTLPQNHARLIPPFVCGLLLVGMATGQVTPVMIATYTFIGLQVGALALLFPVIRRLVSENVIYFPLRE